MYRHGHRALHETVVKERDAHLEPVQHAHRISCPEELIRHICLQIDVQQAVQRMVRLRPAEMALEVTNRPI